MNGPRGAVLIAVLLLISGYLGVMTAHIAGSPIFGIMGFVGFVFAITTLIGEAISQFRQGFNEPRQKKTHERTQPAHDPVKPRLEKHRERPQPTHDPVKRRPASRP